MNRHVNELISSINGVRYFMTHRAAVTLISCMTEQVGVELML